MKLIRSAVLSALMTMPFAAAAQDSQVITWVPGNGQSCDRVCAGMGMRPLSSGVFTPNGKASNNQFYVCAADFNGDGYRAGFNLKPKWSTTCMVAWGPDAVRADDYQCGCE